MIQKIMIKETDKLLILLNNRCICKSMDILQMIWWYVTNIFNR